MSQVPFEMITVGTIPIAHVVAGEGVPLVLLHGWGASIDLVWPIGEKMQKLGYRVYALDMPGMGNSPPPPEAWTVFDYARLVTDYMTLMGIERAHIFGHSFGGRLSLILGADYPERVMKLVLADAAGIRSQPSGWVRTRTSIYKSLRGGLNRVGLTGLSDSLRQAYNRRYGSTDFNATSGVMRQTFVQVINQDLLDHARRVKASILLFWGSADEDTPLSQGQLLEQTIPDAGLIVYDGAGHYSYLEHLTECVRVMDYFFKDNSTHETA